MDVYLKEGVFTQLSRPFAALAFFGFAVEGRHRVLVEREDGPFSSWFGALSPEIQEEVAQARAWSIGQSERNPSDVSITVDDCARSAWGVGILAIHDALALLQKPFRIFLENGFSDRRFLLAMLEAAMGSTPAADGRAYREEFERRAEREWLELEGCGGVDGLKKRVRWAGKETERVLRCAALFDSDATEPARSPTETAAERRRRAHQASQAAAQACESSRISFHMLHRRSIENYLPVATLRRHAKPADGREARAFEKRCKALEVLGLERHVYNMKGGLDGDRGRSPAPPAWLPPERTTPLEKGFGGDIAKLFERPDCAAAIVDDRTACNELRPFLWTLIKKIR